jgi:hypothetical protein
MLDGLLEVLSPGVVVGEFESARRGGVLHFLQLLATHEPSLQKTNFPATAMLRRAENSCESGETSSKSSHSEVQSQMIC